MAPPRLDNRQIARSSNKNLDGLNRFTGQSRMSLENLLDAFPSRQFLQDQLNCERVPATTGLPIMTFGSDMIHCLSIILFSHLNQCPNSKQLAVGNSLPSGARMSDLRLITGVQQLPRLCNYGNPWITSPSLPPPNLDIQYTIIAPPKQWDFYDWVCPKLQGKMESQRPLMALRVLKRDELPTHPT